MSAIRDLKLILMVLFSFFPLIFIACFDTTIIVFTIVVIVATISVVILLPRLSLLFLNLIILIIYVSEFKIEFVSWFDFIVSHLYIMYVPQMSLHKCYAILAI